MKALITQFIVFCGVGGINTVVGLAVILVLSELMDVQYLLANFIGYGVGLCLGYVLHKSITFKATSATDKTGQQVIRFLGVFAVAYIAQFLVLRLLVGDWGWSNILGQITACLVYLGLSFVGNKVITFRLTPS